MNISRLYTRNVVSIPESTSIADAALLMRDRHVGCLLVTKSPPDERRAIGIVTDRDLVVQAVAAAADPIDTTIAEVMTPCVARVSETADVQYALSRMAEIGVRRLAVVRGRDEIVGVVSFDDLVDGLAAELGDLARIIREERKREAWMSDLTAAEATDRSVAVQH